MNPLIPIAAGAGLLYLLLRGAKAAPPGGGGTGGGTGGTGGGGTGATTGRTRILKDAGNTELPGGFAQEYSGNYKRWIELPGVNPGMAIQYEQFESGATAPYGFATHPSPNPGPSGRGTAPFGLLPWDNGQEVTIPDDWPG